MPTSKRRFSLLNMVAVAGVVEPTLSRTDNRIIQINGHPCNIFCVQPVTDAEVNCQLQTNLVRVRGGAVVNMTTGAILGLKIIPLQSNASIAVVVGSLPADQTYNILVYGTEIR